MKAMVLAAGKGTRLGVLGLAVPKVLLPVGGIPIIEHTFSWLKTHGITEVALNVSHHGDQVVDWIGDGTRYGMQVSFSHEDTPLGTAGGVKKMEHFFDGTFVVVYGDILADFDLTAMVRFHKEKGAAATIALIEVADPSQFGIVETDTDGRVRQFVEKPKSVPSPQSPIPNPRLANAAVYVLEKSVFDYIPANTFCDFGYEVFPKLLAAGVPVYGYELSSKDYFVDIGSPEKYRQANADANAGKIGKKTKAAPMRVDGQSALDMEQIYPRVSVIVPAMNEASNLPYVLPRIPFSVREVLLVDGHSTDYTAAVAMELHPKVRIVRQRGKGKADALRCGFAEASGDIVVTMDADGSMRPEELPRFVMPLCGGFDSAKGTRFKGGGGSSDMEKDRIFGNWALARITNLLHRTRYTDVTYGYNAFRKPMLDKVKLAGYGFTIETEMAIKMKKAGARITEIPSYEDARVHGTGKLNSFRDGWRIFRIILKERFDD